MLRLKKLTSVVATGAMIVSMFAGMTFTSFADSTTYNGQTDVGNYTISNDTQLKTLAEKVNAGTSYENSTFTLIDSIDMSSVAWNGIGSGATITKNSTTDSPNVTAGTGFAGTFDGNGKTVTIALTPSKSGIGLFGYIAPTGVVKNLTVAGSVSTTGSYDAIGAVAGFNAGTIDKVTSTAAVTATSSYNVGAIAGFNDAYYTTGAVGVIKNCANSGTVNGNSKTGGIVGENAGLISSCSNTADIRSYGGGKDGTGGIAGRNGNNNTAVETGTIRNCYNTGSISDATASGSKGKWVGGIVGFQNAKSTATNCYSTGTISGYSYYNNIVGNNENALTDTNCYGSQTNGTGTAVKETGKMPVAEDAEADEDGNTVTTANIEAYMKTSGFLSDLAVNADGLWARTAGSFPYLTYEATETSASSSSTPAAGTVYLDGTAAENGTGTADSPFNSYASAVTAAGSGGTIYVKGTVTFSAAATQHDSVTIKRANGFTGTLINIAPGADNIVTLTTMTVDGSNSGTLFNVTDGTLRLRGTIKLQNADIGVNVAAGATVEANKTIISTPTAVNLASATSTCILNDFGGTSITGKIYLAAGAKITVAAALNSAITVECESPAVGTVVAEASEDYEFVTTDVEYISYVNNSYSVQTSLDYPYQMVLAAATV